MSRLRSWLEQRRPAFDGSAPRLDPPRGVLLLGVQGCGKSLAARAMAGVFGVPLLRLDFGALYNKYHGESERNLRETLTTADVMAPCVLWIDEIEKGLATGESDNGTSRRMLGPFLTWMGETGSAGRRARPVCACSCRRGLLRRGTRADRRLGDLHGARRGQAAGSEGRAHRDSRHAAPVAGDGGAHRRTARVGAGPDRARRLTRPTGQGSTTLPSQASSFPVSATWTSSSTARSREAAYAG